MQMGARGGAPVCKDMRTYKGLDMGKARNRKRLGSAQRYVLGTISKSGYWNESCGWYYDSAHQTNCILSTLADHGWVLRTGSRGRYGHFEITSAGSEKIVTLEAERAEAAKLIAEAEKSADEVSSSTSIFKEMAFFL